MMRKSIFLLLCLGWLGACERAAEPPEERSVAESAAIAAPEAVEAVPTAREDVSTPAAPPRKSVTPEPTRAAKPGSSASEPQPALDLSVPQELLEQALESEIHAELAPLLPPLFGEKNDVDSPFQISGRLISDESVDDYWDSIEGAELQFQFKQ